MIKWIAVQLKDFLQEREGRYKPADKDIQGIKRIDKIDFSGNIFLSNKKSKTDMILIKQGDLVISGINVAKGAIAVYEGDDDVKATIHYSSYMYNPDKIDINFFKLFLKSSEFLNAIKEQVPGGIKTEIKPKHLLPLSITIPETVTDQNKIVDIYTKYENDVFAIENEIFNQENYVKLLRQAILKEAMEGKLVKQNPDDGNACDLMEQIKKEKEKLIKEKKIKKSKPLPPIKPEEIPYEIPDNWVWCRLGEMFFVTKLAGFEYTNYIDLKPLGEIPVIRAQNVKPNKILDGNLMYIDRKISEQLERSALTKKSLLITFIGAGIGEVAIFNKKERWHLAPNVAKAEPLFNKISLEYFMWFLLSDYGKHEFFKIKKATAQPSLSMKTIREVNLPVPPYDEQKRIVKKLNELMKYCHELEESTISKKETVDMLLQVSLKEALEPRTCDKNE